MNYSIKGCYFLLWVIYMIVKGIIRLTWKTLEYIIELFINTKGDIE